MTAQTLPSYIDPARVGPWGMFLEQLERVEPHLGPLAEWLDTLRHPKRCLIVDVPVSAATGRRWGTGRTFAVRARGVCLGVKL